MAAASTAPAYRFVLVKRSLLVSHASHFAGGRHAFSCMATSLAAAGHDVHVAFIADRGQVMLYAAMHGLLGALNLARHGEEVTWRDKGVSYHAVIRGSEASPGAASATTDAVARVVAGLMGQHDHGGGSERCAPGDGPPQAQPQPGAWVLIDADDSQQQQAPEERQEGKQPQQQRPQQEEAGGTQAADPAVAAQRAAQQAAAQTPRTTEVPAAAGAGCAAAQPCAARQHATLFEAVVAAAGAARCIALVQNIHFLPFGPFGCGARRVGLLAAWRGVAGIVAVSDFVRRYVVQHWPDGHHARGDQDPTPAPAADGGNIGDGGSASAAAAGEASGSNTATAAGAGAVCASSPAHSRSSGAAGARLSPPSPSSASSGSCANTRCAPNILHVPLAAWGVYGQGPFQDLGQQVLPQLQAWRDVQRLLPLPRQPHSNGALPSGDDDGGGEQRGCGEHEEGVHGVAAAASTATPAEGAASRATLQPPQLQPDQQQQQQQQPAQGACSGMAPPPLLPLLCVLKATPEKGLSVVLGLARRMAGRARFRVVAGDPAVRSALSSAGPWVEVVEPQPDIDDVLKGAWAVLVPSLWLEAWGMVATEALLRGVPALVSDLGGLPEAGMHVCPAVPVEHVRVPCDGATGQPDWKQRSLPPQDIGAWESEVMDLLLADGRWEQLRSSGRALAAEHVAARCEYLRSLEDWLRGLDAQQRRPMSNEHAVAERHRPRAAVAETFLEEGLTRPG